MSEETTAHRTVQLPWGRAVVEDEIVVAGSHASNGRRVEVGLARLRTTPGADGGEPEELLRFFYRVDGRTMRGPLTLRPGEIDELAAALPQAPTLRLLVRRLGK
jgi:hypothetical protein